MKSITADRNKIAPCGLNCAVCSEALRKESPCIGGRNEGYKGEYCANLCKIVKCEIRKTLPDGFCDKCPQYPCREIVDKECWYANDYPMIESLMGNLVSICCYTFHIQSFLNDFMHKLSFIPDGSGFAYKT